MDYTKEEFIEDWRHLLDCVNFDLSQMDHRALMFVLDGPEKICKALDLAQQQT